MRFYVDSDCTCTPLDRMMSSWSNPCVTCRVWKWDGKISIHPKGGDNQKVGYWKATRARNIWYLEENTEAKVANWVQKRGHAGTCKCMGLRRCHFESLGNFISTLVWCTVLASLHGRHCQSKAFSLLCNHETCTKSARENGVDFVTDKIHLHVWRTEWLTLLDLPNTKCYNMVFKVIKWVSQSVKPRFYATIKHSLINMPVVMFHTRNLIQLHSSTITEGFQAKGITEVKLYSRNGTKGSFETTSMPYNALIYTCVHVCRTYLLRLHRLD